MKNKFFLFLMMLGMAFAAACGDDPTVTPNPDDTNDPNVPEPPKIEASMEVAVASKGATQVELKLTTKDIKQYAYRAYESGTVTKEPTALQLFSLGQKGDCADGETTFTINKLNANSAYEIYVAGIDAEDNYYNEGKALKVEVQTEEITGEVSVFDVEIDELKIHVNVNDRVKNGQSAYRWLLQDLCTYNYLVNTLDRHDAFMLEMNDYFFANFITDDHTFHFDNTYASRYLTDENGELITGEEGAFPLYPFLVPGYANYFVLGEYLWGRNPFYSYGDEKLDIGWYDPMLDWEAFMAHANTGGAMAPVADSFWVGYHYREIVPMGKANLYEGQHSVDASTLRPYGGTLTLIADERCEGLSMILADETMMQEFKTYLFNNDDALWNEYLPAFTISEAAVNLANAMYLRPYSQSGARVNIELTLEDFFWITEGATYYLIVNGHGPETKEINGDVQPTFENQYFQILEIKIPTSNLPLPEMVVTPVETEDPYNVTFNIKCTTKDAIYAEYLCDYEDAWKADNMNDEGTLSNMFKTYGSYNRLTGDVIVAINSDAGYDMVIPSRPNAISYLAAVGYNEDRVMGKPATASVRSAKVPLPDPVDEARFAEITGDWTATANIIYTPADSEQAVVATKTSPVKIGFVDYPATTPQEVYDAYPRKSKEAVDELYAEFTALIDEFNNDHRSYNRIVCQGYDFQVPAEGFESYLRYADPYTLFVAPTSVYNGTTTSSILWDFGPKWYIEFQQDGTAYVPFDVTNFAPLSAWIPEGYDYYMIAANIRTGLWTDIMDGGIKGFPVEISDDKNTITIKPLEIPYTDKTTGETAVAELYPQAAFIQTQQYNAFAWMDSEVVLTRNTSVAATAARQAEMPAVKSQKMGINPAGGKLSEVAQPEVRHSRTSLCDMEVRGTKKVTISPCTVEKFHQNGDKLRERIFNAR